VATTWEPAPARTIQELGGRSDSELLDMARRLAYCRPLLPYPGWRFDADWNNPDPAFAARRAIWECLSRRPCEKAVEIGWHYGIRLLLHLENDLGRQLFVGGCIDPNEFFFLDRFLRPGMRVLDVGAHEGLYTLFAARRVEPEGEVWALEPSVREFSRLRQNLKINHLTNVRVFQVAAGEVNGPGELLVAADEHSGHNTLGAFACSGVKAVARQSVDLRPVDELCKEWGVTRLDLIKLDTEGAEHRVLRGAGGVLRRFRPVVLFEVAGDALRHQGSNPEELMDYFRQLGYRLYAFDDRTGLPRPVEEGPLSANLVATPRGRERLWA
jgi:FkbM family methyltransferase